MPLQKKRPLKKFDKHITSSRYKSLEENYGKWKKLPKGYELQALIALSYYPELKDVKIDFVFVKAEQPLTTKPGSPGNSKKRKYRISISTKSTEEKEPLLLKNLPFNIQVGVLGHELAHVVDFLDKNTVEIIKDGIMYHVPKYKRHLEKKTDRITIHHGLGYQILAYSQLIDSLKKKYPQFKYYKTYHYYYMTTSEIKAKISKLKIYSQDKKKS